MPDATGAPTPQERLPDPRDVLVELSFVPRSGAAVGAPGAAVAGRQFRILRTLELDEYEAPLAAADIAALTAPRAAVPDNNFGGTARKVAKLSIVDAPMEPFEDVSDLIDTFVDHATMKAKDIPTTADSDRVAEEERNVRVKAFLYAASMETDNDFHLIIGRDPGKPAKYMTAEVSGLPPQDAGSFNQLNTTRTTYLDFFANGLPGSTYDFYDPPIPIEIEGSLFWDASHATGGRPGPSKLRPNMPVVWEVHPITKITFEP
jgi:hypothetical protein